MFESLLQMELRDEMVGKIQKIGILHFFFVEQLYEMFNEKFIKS